jgi:phosphatidate cytidylyltransferase
MNSNQVLRQRSITGLIFGVAVLSLFLSGKNGAIALSCFIAGFSCYEYIRMIFHKNKKKLISSLLLVVLTIVLISNYSPDSGVFLYLTILSCLFMIVGIIHLFHPIFNHKKDYWMISIFYFGFPMGLLIAYVTNTSTYHSSLWIGMIIMIWMSDSFAYLIGSRIGKRKLFERISPKKSWEGFIGSGICTLIISWLVGYYFIRYVPDSQHTPTLKPEYFWLMVAAIAWVIGTLGDLVESSIKRNFNIKDSGKLLPGHGGVFDRFDSFIYILPFVLFLLIII